MDAKLTTLIWDALLHGGAPNRLGLPKVGDRVDLRGLTAPKPSVVGEFAVPHARVTGLGGLVEISGANWSGVDFSGSDLESLRIFDSAFEDCLFDRTKCHDWRMWGTSVSNCTFRGADLRNAALGGIHEGRRNAFRRVDFSRADLRNTAHGSADMIECTFADTKLTGTDFQGTVFVDCVFEGELNEVLFYRHAFRGDAFPANEMKGVDFRRARFRFVEFRGLDMKDVHWPEDGDHVVVDNYKETLDRMLTFLQSRSDTPAMALAAVLESSRKWAGPNQTQGVISKLDLIDGGDERLVRDLLDRCGLTVN